MVGNASGDPSVRFSIHSNGQWMDQQFDYTLPKVNALLRGSVELERFQELDAYSTGGATGSSATGISSSSDSGTSGRDSLSKPS